MSAPRVRRQGFAGQHLVVVPESIRGVAANHPLLRGLFVTDAGYFPRAAHHRVERPLGSATHLVIACMQGKGWARVSTRTESIAAGDVVWISANHAHAYGADEAEPWTIVWVHCSGDELGHWQNELGWARGPLGFTRVMPDRVPDLRLDQAYDLLEHGYSMQQMLEASAGLRTTFCTLLRLGYDDGAARSATERTRRVRDQLVRAPARSYRLSELAAAAGLSVPHFTLLFRKLTGYAPIDFHIRQRIRAACQLLDTRQIGIAAVAAEVGFQDPYYFSRCFRRIMGCSPVAYQKTIKA